MVLVSLATSACSKGSDEGREVEPAPADVTVDGSSTVFLISRAVADRYPGGQVRVAASGTSGGFHQLCRGELDVAGASRRIHDDEAGACRAAGIEPVELTIAHDGVAVVVSPGADWVDRLTVAELKRMWEPDADGRITRWSQIRAGWPDRALALFGPGPESGTFDHFTQVIVGKEHASRGDVTLDEDDEVLAGGVAGSGAALGYFGFAYYQEHRDELRLVPVDAGAGPVAPDEASILDGRYPLARPLFLYVSGRALERAEVARFVAFYLDAAPEVSRAVGYVPSPGSAYAAARAKLKR